MAAAVSRDAYQNWDDNPILTTVSTTAFPIHALEYPAITICGQVLYCTVLYCTVLYCTVLYDLRPGDGHRHPGQGAQGEVRELDALPRPGPQQ